MNTFYANLKCLSKTAIALLVVASISLSSCSEKTTNLLVPVEFVEGAEEKISLYRFDYTFSSNEAYEASKKNTEFITLVDETDLTEEMPGLSIPKGLIAGRYIALTSPSSRYSEIILEKNDDNISFKVGADNRLVVIKDFSDSELTYDKKLAELFADRNISNDEYDKELVKASAIFIKQNPCMIRSFDLLYKFYRLFTIEEIDLLTSLLCDELKTRPFVQRMSSYNQGFKTGAKFPTIDLITTTGDGLDLDDYLGKYLIIQLWASWCTPCFKEKEAFIEMIADNNIHGFDDNFEIVSISVDESSQKWREGLDIMEVP